VDDAFPGDSFRALNVSKVSAVAVVVDAAGAVEVHVAQRGRGLPDGDLVVVMNTSGAVQRLWGRSNITDPHGLFAGSYGAASTLWVTDVGAATVKEFSLSGELLFEVGTPMAPGSGTSPLQFSAPADGAVVSSGYVVVSDGDGGTNNRVVSMSLHSDGSWQTGFAVGGNGTSPGQFNSPHSVAYASSTGTVWVADRGNSRLQELNGTCDGEGAFATGLTLGACSAASAASTGDRGCCCC
jgi:hypothetical protein